MSTIFDDLYYGRVRPHAAIRPEAPEVREIQQRIDDLEETFFSMLTDDAQERYRQITDAQNQLLDQQSKQGFEVGFSLASQLWAEAFGMDLAD